MDECRHRLIERIRSCIVIGAENAPESHAMNIDILMRSPLAREHPMAIAIAGYLLTFDRGHEMPSEVAEAVAGSLGLSGQEGLDELALVAAAYSLGVVIGASEARKERQCGA